MLTHDSDTQYKIFENHAVHKQVPAVCTVQDRILLRNLAQQVADIVSLPVHRETQLLWRQVNQRSMHRPVVWINEICWNEMGHGEDLVLRTSTPFARMIESQLLQTCFLWNHMPADMVVEPAVYAPLAVHTTGIGLQVDEHTLPSDPENTVVSHEYHTQLAHEDDLEKIQIPTVTHDAERSKETLEAYEDIFSGILPVIQRGIPGFWFAPWDDLVTLCGAQEVLLNLALKPDFMHRAIETLVSAYLKALDQYQALGLLASNNTNVRVGSGAYGYTDDLPEAETLLTNASPDQIWGSAAAQIFSDVSPHMHEEFAVSYERRWLERFALTYYGCCEPLETKLDVLASIPNLRKISVSPWNDLQKICEAVGSTYVISYKPNPAIFAGSTWDLESASRELAYAVRTARRYGCSMEIVMKDISTVHYQPHRLMEWARSAMQICRTDS